MNERKYRYEFYTHLFKQKEKIFEEIKKIPDEIGMPTEMRGNVGLLGGSGGHATLTREVAEAMDGGAYKLQSVATLDTEIRKIIKDVYGDEYDGAAINTCEAALWVSYDVLMSPPFTGRGDNYRTRYIAPYERHMHHQASYGRPFPPRYKDLYADRGVTPGELGFYGKRLANLDVIIVPLAGVKYECHGIKYHPTPFLMDVDARESAQRIADVAKDHVAFLSGFASMAYDSPGYGYGEKDEDGTPILQRMIGDLAQRYNVPYVTDNARGTPFIGTDPRKINADVIVYSTDKAFHGPTGGLIIGKEEVMVQIRRALGMHGQRWGTPSSHGKAAYVVMDPGKEALLGIIAALEVLRDHPERKTEPVDQMFEIAKEEFAQLQSEFVEGLVFTKSYNQLLVEINYQNTWKEGKMGIPIFPIEDFYSGASLLRYGQTAIGMNPSTAYDGNIMMAPGMGTIDKDGNLLEKPARYAIKALVRIIEVLCKYSGVLEDADLGRKLKSVV